MISDYGDPRYLLLDEPHMRTLSAMVREMRTGGLDVPDFDPLDGGVGARAAFLLESPGPRAVGSRFISRDNPDPSAQNMTLALGEAGIDRKDTVLWNVVPYCVSTVGGNRNATHYQIRAAAHLTQAFLDALPNLRVVVFCGRRAQRARPVIRLRPGIVTLCTFHPGARAFNVSRCREHLLRTFKIAAAKCKRELPWMAQQLPI